MPAAAPQRLANGLAHPLIELRQQRALTGDPAVRMGTTQRQFNRRQIGAVAR